MKNNKYKILVLSDLNRPDDKVLENTVSLSKMIDGEISFFHVKKPMDIVDRESQLSTFRTINEKRAITKKRIENIVRNVEDSLETKINFGFVFGNVKNEIEDYININKPDLIVLGKRKPKTLSLGDNITDFVLKKYTGMVMIVDNDDSIQFQEELSLGLIDETNKLFNINITDALLEKSKKPLKSFKFVNNASLDDEKKVKNDSDYVEYVFERNDNSIKNLANFLKRSNVDLLLVDGNYSNNAKLGGLKKSDMKSVINQVKIPLLISNKSKISQAV